MILLSFSNHTFKLSCSCFVHIRDLCRVRSCSTLKLHPPWLHQSVTQNSSLMQLPLSQPRIHLIEVCAAYSKLAGTGCYQNAPGITISLEPILKSLRWLKVPEQIHFKVMLLTYNSLQYSSHPANPFYQAAVLLSQSFSTPVTCHLILSNRAMSLE